MFSVLRRSALFVGIIAAVLSMGLVVPSAASAAAEPKPMPPTPRRLYSVPNEVGGGAGLPSAPTPTGGQVIKGPWRVFPGTTKVIPPSLLKIVGGSPAIGIGIGGSQTAAPLDYIRAGVSWGCAFVDGLCSDAERSTKTSKDQEVISQPGVFGVPLFNDIWSWLTGQTTQGPSWIPVEAESGEEGSYCTKTLTYSGGNNGSFTMAVKRNLAGGQTSATEQLYTNYCGPGTIGDRVYFHATCRKADGTLTGAASTGTSSFALSGEMSFGSYWGSSTGTLATKLCQDGSNLFDLTWYYKKNDPSTTQRTNPGHWVDPDPSKDVADKVEINSTVHCKSTDGSGSIATVTSKTGANSFAGFPACPAGTLPIDYSTTGGLPGQQVSIGSGGQSATAATQAPNCLGTGATGCSMTVKLDNQTCTVNIAGCPGWLDIYSQSPSRIGCFYGAYPVPVSDCQAVLPDAYKTESGASYNPAYPNTAPAPVNGNNLWQAAPSPEPWNPTSPANTPATTPSTSSPGLPATGTAPAFNWNNCVGGGGWSWNPVDWVATPVSCAMQAMFKPSQASAQARGDAMKAKLQAVGVEPLMTAVNNNIAAIGGAAGSGSGCTGPVLNFDVEGQHQTVTPFAACTEPMSTVAGISTALSSLVLVVGGGFGIVRALAMAFGFNFTMGRTGGSDA